MNNIKQIKIITKAWCDNDLYQDRGETAQINMDELSMVGEIKSKCDEQIIRDTFDKLPTIIKNKVYYRWFYLRGIPQSFLMYSKNIKDLYIHGWEDQEEKEKK